MYNSPENGTESVPAAELPRYFRAFDFQKTEGKDAVLVGMTTVRSGEKKKERTTAVVHVQRDGAWTVAAFLVAHAQQYGISQIRYAGYVWNAANGSMGWQRVSGSTASGRTASPVPRGSIVAG